MAWQDQFEGGGGGGRGGGGGFAGGIQGIAAALQGIVTPFISATVQAGKYEAALRLNENPVAVERGYQAEFQRRTTIANTKNYVPQVIGLEAILRQHHQQPSGVDGIDDDGWLWTVTRLKNYGVDCSRPGGEPRSIFANDWQRLVQMAATAAPLGAAVVDYRRAEARGAAAAQAAADELTFHFRRAGISRPQDRALLTNPWYPWSIQDAQRLLWMGVIDEQTFRALCAAAGMVNDDDVGWRNIIAPRRPDFGTLSQWAVRNLWSDDIAARYGLDAAWHNSPVATYWAGVDGLRDGPDANPNAPNGSGDWAKLQFRAGVPLPGLGEAREMQHRLRPIAPGETASIVPGALAWTEANTRDMLIAAGFTEPIIARLMGLVTEPLNVRIVQTVLHEILTHPDVAADIQAAYPDGTDWVLGVYLDYGLAPAVAKAAADAVRAKASDAYFAERIERQKEIEQTRRELALKSYQLGAITGEAALPLIVTEQVTNVMGLAMLGNADTEIALQLFTARLAAVKGAFVEGKLSLDQLSAQFLAMGMAPDRIIYYTQEWIWERGDRARMLSTGEILAALKAGLMTSATALQRLTNIGWTAPDAAVEIALAEQEVAAAAARATATAASKEISSTLRAQREAAAAAKAAASEQAKAARAAKKAADLAAGAPLEQAADASHYDATALADLDAYNKAAAAGDAVKQQEEIAKAVSAYQELLVKQLKLGQEGANEEAEIKPVGVVPVPGAPASQGAGANAASDASQPSAAPAAGTGSPPASNA